MRLRSFGIDLDRDLESSLRLLRVGLLLLLVSPSDDLEFERVGLVIPSSPSMLVLSFRCLSVGIDSFKSSSVGNKCSVRGELHKQNLVPYTSPTAVQCLGNRSLIDPSFLFRIQSS